MFDVIKYAPPKGASNITNSNAVIIVALIGVNLITLPFPIGISITSLWVAFCPAASKKFTSSDKIPAGAVEPIA